MAAFSLALLWAMFIACAFLAARWISRRTMPAGLGRWLWLPLVMLAGVLPFADEAYNEIEARRACAAEGGLTVRERIAADSLEAGMALIASKKLDIDEPRFWRHELVFVYQPTGVELARLRWFDRKHGWLQGNAPGADQPRFLRARSCPDPQQYLTGKGVRANLVAGRATEIAPAQ